MRSSTAATSEARQFRSRSKLTTSSRVNVPADFTKKVYDLLQPGASVVITSEPLRRAEAGSALTVLRADESAEAPAAAPAAPRGPVAPVSAAAPALPVN